MGIVIDIVLIIIIILSAFFGYKKGLVKLGAKLLAGIIAIILTLVIYKPVTNIIIKQTNIDEKIENIIIEKTTNAIDEKTQISDNKYVQETTNNITNQIQEDVVPKQARNISEKIVYISTILILFIAIKLILTIIISLADTIAKLPILKQFNEIGGLAYGIIRGIIIACICVILLGIFIKIKPNQKIEDNIKETYITKFIYKNIVKF